jgi:hypothetical protein
MLPMPIQFILAIVVYGINERIARRVEYLQEEVLVLKEAFAAATGNARTDFTPEQRRRLALKGSPSRVILFRVLAAASSRAVDT